MHSTMLKLLKENGYQVVILGDKSHPEVKGNYELRRWWCRSHWWKYPASQAQQTKVGIVGADPAQPVEAWKKRLQISLEHVKEVKVYNTICNSTALRLKETANMARKVDVMIVGGAKIVQIQHSCHICALPCLSGHDHIETEEELKKEWI